jgi:hypothetical protein
MIFDGSFREPFLMAIACPLYFSQPGQPTFLALSDNLKAYSWVKMQCSWSGDVLIEMFNQRAGYFFG